MFEMKGVMDMINKKIGIGIYSSSTPISCLTKTRYQRGFDYLTSKGFNVINGSLFEKSDFYRSGTILERAKEFNELLYNPEVDILMPSIGGLNSNSLLPYIDYNYLKEHPKIIIGFSDTCAISLAILAKTKLITYYGQSLCATFGELEPFVQLSYESFINTLFKKNIVYQEAPFWTDEFIEWESQKEAKKAYVNEWGSIGSGVIEGRLIGGNLNTMEGFILSEYWPTIEQGDILFLEDSMKDAQTIERSFAMLKLAGIFDKVSAIILGKHELYNSNNTKRLPKDVLQEVLMEHDIPILYDVDCGHTHPMYLLPIGSKIRLDLKQKTIQLIGEENNG